MPPQQPTDPLTALQGAQTIGAPQIGTRYVPTEGPQSLLDLFRQIVLGGMGRPAEVIAQDPYGILGWERGAGAPPMMLGTTGEPPAPGGGGLLDKLAETFPRFAKAIKAYHGSPHDFEQFSSQQIGTGEGAQAFGHGLYFAENPATAQSYKEGLSARPISVKPGVTLTAEEQGLAKYFSQYGIDVNAATPLEAGDAMRAHGGRGDFARWKAALDTLRAKVTQGEAAGRMYEVAIHADPEHFLDWDKPFAQQSPHVQTALKKAGVQAAPEMHVTRSPGPQNPLQPPSWEVRDAQGNFYGYSASQAEAERHAKQVVDSYLHDGSQLLRQLGSDVEASTKLREAGIPGIKYLDQGSRTSGEGTRNYVVFDDKTIEILKKYGILLPAAGMGAAAQVDRR